MAKRSKSYGYRIIVSADHHMSNNLSYARPSENGRTDRLDDQLAQWDDMTEYAAKVEADGIFLLGDLFDKARLDPVTLVETATAIKMLSGAAPVYILPGNHDAATIKGERFNVELFRNTGERITYMGFSQLAHLVPVPWLMFWPLEYMPVQQTREALVDIRRWRRENGDERTHVLLFHNSVVGCEHLAWVCDDGIEAEELLDGFDWAIGGHFHTHQKFGKGNRGMYTGAWMQHDFGDRGEDRGFWDITFTPDGKCKTKLIPTKAPRFWYADPFTVATGAKPGDYMRWTVEITHAEFVMMKPDLDQAVSELADKGLHVDYKLKPIHHHTERIIKSGDMAELRMRKMVPKYVDSDHVELGDLDPKRLKKMGAEIMAEAERD